MWAFVDYLPLGRSESSLLQRTVGTGSPWTAQWNSTLSSASTTLLLGRLTKVGRSGSQARAPTWHQGYYWPPSMFVLLHHFCVCPWRLPKHYGSFSSAMYHYVIYCLWYTEQVCNSIINWRYRGNGGNGSVSILSWRYDRCKRWVLLQLQESRAVGKWKLQLPLATACPSSFVLRSLVQIKQWKEITARDERENRVAKFDV